MTKVTCDYCGKEQDSSEGTVKTTPQKFMGFFCNEECYSKYVEEEE